MTDPIPARLAALKTTPMPELKAQWRDALRAPSRRPFNRRYLESRLAYRIQELAYGGLKPETIRSAWRSSASSSTAATSPRRRIRHDAMPVAGTRLIREYQGVEHTVTVLADGYEWQGRPYRSLSAIARAITGTRWNGLVFFGLKRQRRRGMTEGPMQADPQAPLRGLHPQVAPRKGSSRSSTRSHAQREACEAYVASQRSEGWALIRDPYDDGGFSGGTLERPALKRLLADIEEGLVDVVVVYKIDRLSRSLMDFSKLVEVFDRAGVTFVSVTQSFNTTTSMGRLTLNILLSFAQFEREVIAERIRDKIAASRAEGHVDGRQRAARLRGRRTGSSWCTSPTRRPCAAIFERFVRIGSATVLARELRARGRARPSAGKPDRQGLPLQAAEQPDLPRPGGAQGHRIPRRARGDHRPGPVGQGARDPRRERPHPVGATPGRRRRRC